VVYDSVPYGWHPIPFSDRESKNVIYGRLSRSERAGIKKLYAMPVRTYCSRSQRLRIPKLQIEFLLDQVAQGVFSGSRGWRGFKR